MRMSSLFSCSLNHATKDRTDDIIVTSRCWTTASVFPVLWTMFCRAFLPLLSFAHVIMTRAFFFTSSSAIWNPLPTIVTKGQIISVLLKPSELDFVRLAFSCEGFIFNSSTLKKKLSCWYKIIYIPCSAPVTMIVLPSSDFETVIL